MRKNIPLACVCATIDPMGGYLLEMIEMITFHQSCSRNARSDIWIIHRSTCFYKVILGLGRGLRVDHRGEGGREESEFTG